MKKILEYTNKVVTFLTKKWKQEDPSLTDEKIINAINIFDKHKSSQKIKSLKFGSDITKYTFKEIEIIVDDFDLLGRFDEKLKKRTLTPVYSDELGRFNIYKTTSLVECEIINDEFNVNSYCLSSAYGYYSEGSGYTWYWIILLNKPSQKNSVLIGVDGRRIVWMDYYSNGEWDQTYEELIEKYPMLDGLKYLYKFDQNGRENQEKKIIDDLKARIKGPEDVKNISDRDLSIYLSASVTGQLRSIPDEIVDEIFKKNKRLVFKYYEYITKDTSVGSEACPFRYWKEFSVSERRWLFKLSKQFKDNHYWGEWNPPHGPYIYDVYNEYQKKLEKNAPNNMIENFVMAVLLEN